MIDLEANQYLLKKKKKKLIYLIILTVINKCNLLIYKYINKLFLQINISFNRNNKEAIETRNNLKNKATINDAIYKV